MFSYASPALVHEHRSLLLADADAHRRAAGEPRPARRPAARGRFVGRAIRFRLAH